MCKHYDRRGHGAGDRRVRVRVDYTIAEEVVDPHDVLGGLRIRVDGTRLNRYCEEASEASIHEWWPEYVGEYLQTDLVQLVERARRLAAGTHDLYDEVVCEFRPGSTVLFLEPVSLDRLRLGCRRSVPTDRPAVVPASARGYLVDRCAFCRAVSSAANEYVEELRSMPLQWGLDLLEEFEASLDELDTVLETCTETPPGATESEAMTE